MPAIDQGLLTILAGVIAAMPPGAVLADLPACPAAGIGSLACVLVDREAGEVDLYGVQGLRTVPLELLAGVGTVVRPPPPPQAAPAPAGGLQQLSLF